MGNTEKKRGILRGTEERRGGKYGEKRGILRGNEERGGAGRRRRRRRVEPAN